MDKDCAVRCIVEGMEVYFRAFALADTVEHYTGDIEWIAPLPGAPGPAIVFRVALDERGLTDRLARLIPQLDTGDIPSFWVLTPMSRPSGVLDALVASGFSYEPNPDHPESGMALDLGSPPAWPAPKPGVSVKKVATSAAFGEWIEVVNEALHGWKLLSLEHYRPWLLHDEFAFYLGYLDGKPVATVATFREGDSASLEFVSTLAAYRRRGVALAACAEALRQLHEQGVRIATLRSSPEAVPLYTRLGFVPYYEQTLISYQRRLSG